VRRHSQEGVWGTHVRRGDLKNQSVSSATIGEASNKAIPGLSYLGGDQGRETTAGDVAHLVWTVGGQILVAIDCLGLEYSIKANEKDVLSFAARVNRERLMMQEEETLRSGSGWSDELDALNPIRMCRDLHSAMNLLLQPASTLAITTLPTLHRPQCRSSELEAPLASVRLGLPHLSMPATSPMSPRETSRPARPMLPLRPTRTAR
jgi:hypothetical protein